MGNIQTNRALESYIKSYATGIPGPVPGGGSTPYPNTYSLDFDGVDDRVIMEDVNLGGSGAGEEVTISFWVKRGATGNTEMILGNDAVSGATVIKFTGTTSMEFQAYGLATFNNAATQTALARTDWMHVLFTLDSSNVCILYIDGALTETGTGAPNSVVVFDKIGIGQIAGYPTILANAFTGNIDEVSGFKSKLSADDIALISAAPIDLKTALSVTPEVWYRNGDSGTFFASEWDIPDQMKIDNWSSYSMEFDGVDDYIDCGAITELSNASAFSISCWAKFDDIDSNDNLMWCTIKDANEKIRFWNYGGDIFLTMATSAADSVGNFPMGSAEGYANDTWYHLVVVFDGSGAANADRAKFYLDGVNKTLAFTGTIPATTFTNDGTKPFTLGKDIYQYPTYLLPGSLDEISIFNTALSSGDVTTIYNSGEPTDLSTFSLKSFVFDGVDDYISVPSDSAYKPTTGKFSVSLWFYATTGYDSIMAGGGYSHINTGFEVYMSNRVHFSLNDGVSTTTAIEAGYFTMNAWNHFLGTWDGSDMTVYINGVAGTPVAFAGPISWDAAKALYIGTRYVYLSSPYHGNLCDIAIFDNDQSANAVAIYNSGKPSDLSEETGLVGYWKFDDAIYNGATTEFSVPDSSENSNTGDTVNMDFVDLETSAPLSPVAYYRMGENGVFNANTEWELPNYQKRNYFSNLSMTFDGVDDYIDTGLNISAYTSFTVSGWINAAALAVGDCVFGQWRHGNTANSSWLVYTEGANKLKFYIGDGGSAPVAGGDTALVLGQWYHICITWNGTTNILYINGVAESTTGSPSSMNASTVDMLIGAYNNTGGTGIQYTFDGNIDDVSIYNSALSALEVSAIFNSGVPKDESATANLVGYWRMGEGSYWNATNWQLPDYSKQALFSQKSFVFDGVDQSITTGLDCASATHPNLSVSCWIKLNSAPATAFPVGVKASSQPFPHRSSLGLVKGGALYYKADGAWVAGSSVADGNWHNVIWVFEYNTPTAGDITVNVYLDGNTTPDLTAVDTYNGQLTGDLYIGSLDGASYYFDGNVDDVSVYNVAKSGADISAIYNSGVPKDESATSGLIGYWTFDDATFDTNWTIPDNSTNSNTGTSANMDEVDLQLISPTNPNRGLSSGMAVDDVINQAPDNMEQGLSVAMDEVDKINNAPDNTAQGRSVAMVLASRVEQTP